MEFNLSTLFLRSSIPDSDLDLQHLFYKPLLEAIAKRKQLLTNHLTMQKISNSRRNNNAAFMKTPKVVGARKTGRSRRTVSANRSERKTQMDRLNADLEQEKQKAKVTLSRQQQELQQQAEKQACKRRRFAGILLQQSASPELEAG